MGVVLDRKKQPPSGYNTVMKTNRTPQEILQSVFGFEQFISLQPVVIENVLNRLKAAPPPDSVETHLEIAEAPIADAGRYDRLREEVGHA